MTQPTRQQVLELIRLLMPNRITINKNGGHSYSIMIGDCLLKMLHKGCLYDESEHLGIMKYNSDILIYNWQPCGFTKSLQEIIEASGWENKVRCSKCGKVGLHITDLSGECEWKGIKTGDDNHVSVTTERLKEPAARELAAYLIDLFLN